MRKGRSLSRHLTPTRRAEERAGQSVVEDRTDRESAGQRGRGFLARDDGRLRGFFFRDAERCRSERFDDRK